MADEPAKPDFSDVESRRSKDSGRRMSRGRRIYYAIGMPVVQALVKLVWSTYRVEKVIGEDIEQRILSSDETWAPCYWHQLVIPCNLLMRQWLKRGFRACFLISASVDGDVPARIARSWGAEIIRGSATRTGALVLRDMQRMLKKGVSIVSLADGPMGPVYEFKSGVALMARIGGVPMIPIACAADRAWYLNRWDNFMIPKPFARLVFAIGEPVQIPRGTSVGDIEPYRKMMEDAVNSLMEQSKNALAANSE